MFRTECLWRGVMVPLERGGGAFGVSSRRVNVLMDSESFDLWDVDRNAPSFAEIMYSIARYIHLPHARASFT